MRRYPIYHQPAGRSREDTEKWEVRNSVAWKHPFHPRYRMTRPITRSEAYRVCHRGMPPTPVTQQGMSATPCSASEPPSLRGFASRKSSHQDVAANRRSPTSRVEGPRYLARLRRCPAAGMEVSRRLGPAAVDRWPCLIRIFFAGPRWCRQCRECQLTLLLVRTASACVVHYPSLELGQCSS